MESPVKFVSVNDREVEELRSQLQLACVSHVVNVVCLWLFVVHGSRQCKLYGCEVYCRTGEWFWSIVVCRMVCVMV